MSGPQTFGTTADPVEDFKQLWTTLTKTSDDASYPQTFSELRAAVDKLDTHIRQLSKHRCLSAYHVEYRPAISITTEDNKTSLTIHLSTVSGGNGSDVETVTVYNFGSDNAGMQSLTQAAWAILQARLRPFVMSFAMIEPYKSVMPELLGLEGGSSDDRVSQLEKELSFTRYCLRALCRTLVTDSKNSSNYYFNKIISEAIALRQAEQTPPPEIHGVTEPGKDEKFVRNILNESTGRWSAEFVRPNGTKVVRLISPPTAWAKGEVVKSLPTVTSAKTATENLPSTGNVVKSIPEPSIEANEATAIRNSPPSEDAYEDDGLGGT